MSTVHQQPSTDPELDRLYADFEAEHLNPLWTQLGDLMPMTPTSKAVPFVWKWSTLYPLAQRAGDLVPVGRGGERRAIALANPGLGGVPYVTPTLWAAIQYLGPKEVAPEHRHARTRSGSSSRARGCGRSSTATRCAMRRGDFLLTPGLELPRPPQRDRSADGLDRRPRHPVRALHRHRVLRIRLRERHRRVHPGHLALGAAVGASGAAAAGRAGREDVARRSPPTGGSTPTPRCASSWRSRTRGTRRPPSRATPRSATPTRPPAAT